MSSAAPGWLYETCMVDDPDGGQVLAQGFALGQWFITCLPPAGTWLVYFAPNGRMLMATPLLSVAVQAVNDACARYPTIPPYKYDGEGITDPLISHGLNIVRLLARRREEEHACTR